MKEVKSNKLSEEEFSYVVLLVRDHSMEVTPAVATMCEYFELEYSTEMTNYCKKKLDKMGIISDRTLEESQEYIDAKNRTFDKNASAFLITYAQSYAKLNKKMLQEMEAYASEINAEIIIIPGRYKNPTSLSKSKEITDNEKRISPWPEETLKYLFASPQSIHRDITICADLKIQPTAALPLSGIESFTSDQTTIVGHPRIHLITPPRIEGYHEKVLLTTGSITDSEYTDTKIGKIGEFHHQYGFTIVELNNNEYHIRQIQCENDGSFYDLDNFVKDGTVVKYREAPLGIVLGDLHIGEEDKQAVKSSFDMIEKLRVRNVICHDIFNGHSISHHEKNNIIIQYNREKDGTNSLSSEIETMCQFFENAPKDLNFVCVRSNHDDFLDRWITDNDWRRNPNKVDYLKYVNAIVEGNAPKGVIPYVLENRFKNVTGLYIDSTYVVGDYECAMHGHVGANGSRGSANQFKKLHTKTITGHTHAPIRIDGHISVGCLTKKRVGYNVGPSSWMHANVIIYPNGKASHIFLTKSYKWTTLM